MRPAKVEAEATIEHTQGPSQVKKNTCTGEKKGKEVNHLAFKVYIIW